MHRYPINPDHVEFGLSRGMVLLGLTILSWVSFAAAWIGIVQIVALF